MLGLCHTATRRLLGAGDARPGPHPWRQETSRRKCPLSPAWWPQGWLVTPGQPKPNPSHHRVWRGAPLQVSAGCNLRSLLARRTQGHPAPGEGEFFQEPPPGATAFLSSRRPPAGSRALAPHVFLLQLGAGGPLEARMFWEAAAPTWCRCGCFARNDLVLLSGGL